MNNSYDDNLQKGWLGKLEAGLTKSSLSLTNSLNELLVKKKLDPQTLEEIEDVLITADLGVETAHQISKKLASTRFGKDANPTEVRRVVADEIIEILSPVAQPLSLNPANRPHVILVCGVNGTGKTTTVGKLAHKFVEDGKHVMLAAGDTFRAAATEQLKIWGERAACPVISKETGSDPAGLVFEAFQQARKDNADVLLIDTAGRLQNNTELMEELQKIIRVVQRFDKTAPHSCLLVLDATVGQNAHSQVEIFLRMVNVTGLILTKIDGSAKGGVLVSLAQKNGLPVHAIGVGEQPDDLQTFSATDFALSLLDIRT
ncbi:MAG TPA: signal recognition particle-docking protein FtsY [Rhodospirillales bacterium]|nr:signal recognition particle-docking protein FtsY [Rhodospirillales bacterium]